MQFKMSVMGMIQCASVLVFLKCIVSHEPVEKPKPTNFLDHILLEGCNSTMISNVGYIKSKNYPGEYEHNMNCFHDITVGEGLQIVLKVISMRIEGSGACPHDYLKFEYKKDGQYRHVTKLCGTGSRTTNYTLPSHEGRVVFHSDSSVAYAPGEHSTHYLFSSDA